MTIPARFLPLYFTLAMASGQQPGQTELLRVSVEGSLPGMEVPIEFPPEAWKDHLPLLEGNTVLGDGQGLLLQSAPGVLGSDGIEPRRTFCAILEKGFVKGERELRRVSGAGEILTFVKLDGGRIQLQEDDKPVFIYNFGVQSRPGVAEDRRRSSYIHPISDLEGKDLTDDFPADHVHHRGLSWMWPRVKIAGQQYDLWHIQGLRQHFEGWLAQETGPVCATLGVENSWRVENRKVVDERVWMRAFRAGPHGRALDVSLTWRALEPVELLGQVERGYGGLCFRLAPRAETTISTAAGTMENDSDLQPHPWADQSARFGGSRRFSGVAIFQHSGNPNFPAGWCLRHYGFLGVSWPGLKPYVLEPDQPLTLRYRIWVHDGNVTEGRVAEAFEAFADLPVIRLR